MTIIIINRIEFDFREKEEWRKYLDLWISISSNYNTSIQVPVSFSTQYSSYPKKYRIKSITILLTAFKSQFPPLGINQFLIPINLQVIPFAPIEVHSPLEDLLIITAITIFPMYLLVYLSNPIRMVNVSFVLAVCWVNNPFIFFACNYKMESDSPLVASFFLSFRLLCSSTNPPIHPPHCE